MGVGLLKRIDENHASVCSFVVHTSRLGPAARYKGIRAVSTVAKKRNGAAGMDADGVLCDARPTSTRVSYGRIDPTLRVTLYCRLIWPQDVSAPYVKHGVCVWGCISSRSFSR